MPQVKHMAAIMLLFLAGCTFQGGSAPTPAAPVNESALLLAFAGSVEYDGKRPEPVLRTTADIPTALAVVHDDVSRGKRDILQDSTLERLDTEMKKIVPGGEAVGLTEEIRSKVVSMIRVLAGEDDGRSPT